MRALFLLAALLPTYHVAPPPGTDPLDLPVTVFRALQIPIAQAFLTVSRSYGLTFILEPGVKGEVALEVKGGQVRDLVDALAASQGCYWRREGRLIAIRRNCVRIFEIDYPQMTRSAQGTSNVVLSAQSPAAGILGAAGTYGTTPAYAAGAANGGLPNQNDQTTLSIQQQNQNTFWADLQAELTALAHSGETVTLNKLAGVVVVTAPPARQEDFAAILAMINRRISRQVRISARIVEVDLNAQHQLGVDWTLAATKIGGLTLGNLATSTAFSSSNGTAFVPSTVTGTLAAGKVAAAISALQEQGEVHAVSNPSVISLSNQTAFVKVGTEQTFFSLANSTTINQTGATLPYSTTQISYTQNAITIGTVLYVTPEVNADGTITVDVLPAVTQLIGVDSSPNGEQTAPRMDIKALSTLARLRPDESVMIGGLIYNQTSQQTQKVPGLGDLPWIGQAFGTTGTMKSRSELVIFLSAETVR